MITLSVFLHKDKALLSLQYKSFFKGMSKLKRGVALIAELFENTEGLIPLVTYMCTCSVSEFEFGVSRHFQQ
jgi:hypothetical protein